MDIQKELLEFSKSKIIRRVCVVSVVIILLLLSFRLGVWVGNKKGTFACQYSENYERVFGADRFGTRGFPEDIFREDMGGHGSMGKIVSIHLPTIVITNPSNTETTVYIGNNTVVRKLRENIAIDNLVVGDVVVILGSPNSQGQINAALIRVLPSPPESSSATSSSIPLIPSSTNLLQP